MATFRESPVNRFLIAVLSRWRGEAIPLQEARRMRQLLRFAGVFGVTILLPAMLLAGFALTSIRSEELSVDADLRSRAASLESQMQQDASSLFLEFEKNLAGRLAAGGSPLEQLSSLSPHLRLAVRLGETGDILAPFLTPDPDEILPDPATFRRPWRRAIAADADGRWNDAALEYEDAFRGSTHERLMGEAALGRAVAKIRAGGDAVELLNEVYSDHATVRDRGGFRIGDLVLLHQAQERRREGTATAAPLLQDLIQAVLQRRWTLGQATEPAVARRALELLPPSYEDAWQARARIRLRQKVDQLRWAERASSELELLATTLKLPANDIRYLRGSDRTLWAVTLVGTEPHLFAFDHDALVKQLRDSASRSSSIDDQLLVSIVEGQPAPGAFTRRSLGPWLPLVTLAIHPEDPEALALQKVRRRRLRILVVVLAVFLVFVGVVLAARIVGRELENARMKADFAANVSHELRSPITQIRLKAESLQLDLCYDDDDRRQHYDAIVNESERLSRLVDNVLDFAAIERGAKRYSFRSDNLADVVAFQAEAARGLLLKRGLTLELVLPDDLPPVWIDREAVGQVLTNLLSNAAKYGSDGGWVGVRVRESSGGVELTVADKGIGIAEEELPQIFDDFFRSTDPSVRRRKGTGIGLAIVRYIVEAHGGSIRVDSVPLEGTTFTLTFPDRPPEPVNDHAAHPVR